MKKKPTKKSRAYRARVIRRTEATQRALERIQRFVMGPTVRIVTVPYPPSVGAAAYLCAVEDLAKVHEQTAISLGQFAAAIQAAYPKRRQRPSPQRRHNIS